MTWDISKLKRQRRGSEPIEVEEAPPPEEELEEDERFTDEMATRALAEMLLEEPVAISPPTALVREEYAQHGLIHPGDLPMIRRQMSRGRYELDGFSPRRDVWPIDEPD